MRHESRLRQRRTRRRRSDSASSRSDASDSDSGGDGVSGNGDDGRRSQRRRQSRWAPRSTTTDGDRDNGDMDDRDATRGGLSFEHLEAIRAVEMITRNEYPLPHLPREKLFKADDAYAVCFCTYPREDDDDDDDDPNTRDRRCDDVSCLNFATYIECSPSRCDAGRYCQNQRLQHPERFPRLEAFKTLHKGYGVRTRERIHQGRVIGEYVGEIIDQKELNRRLASMPRNELNFYYLALEPGVFIDARVKGGFTRFMNHSCEPNCKTEKWTVRGEIRIAVLALRDIADGEELTFDYQWKALGSKQIVCRCESANCKGVIGSDADAAKRHVGPQGVFREPTPDEWGPALIGRRIRLFVSPADTSLFAVAHVRGYRADDQKDDVKHEPATSDDTSDDDDGLYELEFEDDGTVGTPEDIFASPPTSALEELRAQSAVRLRGRFWHIYVELQGLSEDQIEQAVFSIPKRRISATPDGLEGDASNAHPPPLSSPSPTSHSHSPPERPHGPSSTGTSPAPTPMRDADGELLDGDGEVVTNKILIKGIPTQCDEHMLRRLFVVAGPRSGGSMLDQLRVQTMPKDVVTKLDYFFFDNASPGWALIEFNDTSYPSIFKRNLHCRQLLGKSLRVYHAGQKQVDTFLRTKRNVDLRRQAQAAAAAAAAFVDQHYDVAADETSTTPQVSVSCYGRPLNWQVTVEQVEDSPSRHNGLSASLEDNLRSKYVKMILRVATTMHLEREDATSAILALHRFYTFHPIHSTNSEASAAAMLHIYLKAHGRRFSWPTFVAEMYDARYAAASSASSKVKRQSNTLDPQSAAFKHWERQILEVEEELLEGLLYDLSSADPYGLLDALTSTSARRRSIESNDYRHSLPPPPLDVQKEAKHMMSEVLRLTVWAHSSVECVVLSTFYVSAAALQAIADGVEHRQGPWTPCPIPSFLPELNPSEYESEVLALQECTLAIADSLRERWIRQEKQAIAARQQALRAKGPDYFDTEAFAVQHHKPVEMTQRMASLLKAWIKTDSSPRATTAEGFDLAAAKKSLPQAVEVIVRAAADSAHTKTVKVSEVLQTKKDVASHRPPRLRVRDVEGVEQIRKRAYLGTIQRDCRVELAGQAMYIQPWPYRDNEPLVQEQTGVSRSCARELATALGLFARAPRHFHQLLAIVFPDDHVTNSNNTAAREVDDLEDSLEFATSSGSSSTGSARDKLNSQRHYLAFEQPLHVYSGLLEAKVSVSSALRKRALWDILSALAACHEASFVHRYVAPCHIMVFGDGIRLGGCQTARRVGLRSKDAAYDMSESERKELCHGSWVQVTAPELLLGSTQFTWRSDIWSAGCVALQLLFDKIPFLQGSDVRSQLNLAFRLCGTPHAEWPAGVGLPSYGHYQPKHEYRMRLRKTLVEHRNGKRLDFPDSAIDLLEAMLQLDPAKRASARTLLGMRYFAEFHAAPPGNLDVLMLPATTFDVQRRKFRQQLLKAGKGSSSSSLKRHRSDSGHDGRQRGDGDHRRARTSSSASDHGRDRRRYSSSSSSSRRHSGGGTTTMLGSAANAVGTTAATGPTSTTAMSNAANEDEDEDVPLPPSLQDVGRQARDDGEDDTMIPASGPTKRAKLGWGMGLSQRQRQQHPEDTPPTQS